MISSRLTCMVSVGQRLCSSSPHPRVDEYRPSHLADIAPIVEKNPLMCLSRSLNDRRCDVLEISTPWPNAGFKLCRTHQHRTAFAARQLEMKPAKPRVQMCRRPPHCPRQSRSLQCASRTPFSAHASQVGCYRVGVHLLAAMEMAVAEGRALAAKVQGAVANSRHPVQVAGVVAGPGEAVEGWAAAQVAIVAEEARVARVVAAAEEGSLAVAGCSLLVAQGAVVEGGQGAAVMARVGSETEGVAGLVRGLVAAVADGSVAAALEAQEAARETVVSMGAVAVVEVLEVLEAEKAASWAAWVGAETLAVAAGHGAQ